MPMLTEDEQRRRRRRRIIIAVLIALGLIVAVLASPVLYIRWVLWRGHAIIAKEAPGYWVATPYPFFGRRVLIGMLVDPALQRQCNAAARDLNESLPQFKHSLVVVPLRIVNLGQIPYRHGLEYRLMIREELPRLAAAQENWYDWSRGAQHVTPSNLARYIRDPRARARLAARDRPAPGRRTTDMFTVCQFLEGKSFDLRQVRVSMDTDPFGYELKPNFRGAFPEAPDLIIGRPSQQTGAGAAFDAQNRSGGGEWFAAALSRQGCIGRAPGPTAMAQQLRAARRRKKRRP